MSKGFIKISRCLKHHWVMQDPKDFQRWVLMLMTVNYKDSKFKVGGEIITIKRGQSALSLEGWSNVFGCGRKATTNFFNLLESDGMISRTTIGRGNSSTTLINIDNYERFQGTDEQQKEQQTTPQRNSKGTANGIQYKKEKKEKNIVERKALFKQSIIDFQKDNPTKYPKELYKDFYQYWTEHGDNDKKMRFEKQKSFGLGRRLATWSKNDFNKYQKENNKGLTLDMYTAKYAHKHKLDVWNLDNDTRLKIKEMYQKGIEI